MIDHFKTKVGCETQHSPYSHCIMYIHMRRSPGKVLHDPADFYRANVLRDLITIAHNAHTGSRKIAVYNC